MNKKTIILLSLSAAVIISLIFHAGIYRIAPFNWVGDVFEYFKFTQTIISDQSTANLSDITGSTFAPYFPVYAATPLFFVLNGVSSLITGLNLPLVMIILNLLKISLLALLVYFLMKKLFKNTYIALFSSIFFLFGMSNPDFSYLLTRNFNLINFFTVILVYLYYFQNRNKKLLYIISFLLLSMLLFHHQTGFIFFLIFFLFVLINEIVSLKNQKIPLSKNLFAVLTLLLSPLVLFAVVNLNYISKFFTAATQATVSAKAIHEAITPDIFMKEVGFIPFVFILFGLHFLFIRSHYSNTVKIFFAVYTLTCLLIFPLSGNWVAKRLLEQWNTLAVLLGGLSIYHFTLYFRKPVLKVLISGSFILVFLLFFINSFININLDDKTPRSYYEGLFWIKDNIAQEKVLSDPLTLFMIQGIGDIKPAYEFIRPVSDYGQIEGLNKVFRSDDVTSAIKYLKENEIKYIVVDTEYTKVWGGESLEKFSSEYFEKIYTIHYKNYVEFSVYRLIQ